MFIVQLLSCVIIFTIIRYLWQRRQFYMLHCKFPSFWGHPLLGIAYEFRNIEDVIPTIEKCFDELGSTVFTWLGPIPILLVSDPETIEDVLKEGNLKKGSLYQAFDTCLGRGLFSMDDPDWTVHRRLLNPAFYPTVLNSFFPIFNEESTDLIQKLDESVGKGEINLQSLCFTLTLNIAIRTTMGSNSESETPAKKAQILQASHIFNRMTELFAKPWLRIEPLRPLFKQFQDFEENKEIFHEFVRKMINIKLMEKSTDWEPACELERNIFVNLAIDNFKNGVFSSANLKEHCLNIISGAVESPATLILSVLIVLAMFPDYDEKLFEEIRSVLPESDHRDITTSDVENMRYMDLVIKETMRVLPTVPLVIREVDKEFKLSNGVILPKGLRIWISLFTLHRSKKIWGPDAHTFNPDRFLPANMEHRHPYSYIPFLKGKRNCIGRRYALSTTKIVLARVLRKYRFTTSFKFEDIHFVEDIKLKFKEMPLLKVHRRDL